MVRDWSLAFLRATATSQDQVVRMQRGLRAVNRAKGFTPTALSSGSPLAPTCFRSNQGETPRNSSAYVRSEHRNPELPQVKAGSRGRAGGCLGDGQA